MALGCAPLHDLVDVPIVGATGPEEDALRQELEELDGHLLVDTELREIEVTDAIGEGASGRFHGNRKRIKVLRQPYLGVMRAALRHEVCHAVDFQSGGLSQAKPQVEAGLSLFRDDFDPYLERGMKKRQQEGFARLCEQGPAGLAALVVSATDPDVAQAARALGGVFSDPPGTQLTPWVALEGLGYPNKVLQKANNGMTLLYGDSDFYFYDSEGAPLVDSVSVDFSEGDPGTDTIPFYELNYFEGTPLRFAQSASGVSVAFVVPLGSDDVHLFAKEPGHMWARLARVEPRISTLGGVYLQENEGIVTVAWMDGTTFRLDRIY